MRSRRLLTLLALATPALAAAFACTSFDGTDQPDLGTAVDGAAADGAASDGAGSSDASGATDGTIPVVNPRRVFVSDALLAPGPEAGATNTDPDRVCEAEAADAGLGGTWVAWLSTANKSDPDSRLGKELRTWVLMDGTPVITRNLLGFDPIKHAIDRTKRNELATGDNTVWTGTTQGGSLASTCTNWGSSSANGTYGRWDKADKDWSNAGTSACGEARRFYCFEK